jgi:serine/threonine-protein phosphatase PP1 catalytic subunit
MNYHTNDQIQFLFLGDIVDQGEFFFGTLIIILILKIKYPQNIFIIRGNHETLDLASKCGLKE